MIVSGGVQAAAARAPGRTALVAGASRLSFGELDRAIDAAGSGFRAATTSVGENRAWAVSAARATAGAVSRPSGSTGRLSSGSSGRCSRTPETTGAAVTTSRFAQSPARGEQALGGRPEEAPPGAVEGEELLGPVLA
ncbi:hypothetical protein [Caldinitratiruptor microaerophilus]|uniref:Uncharacterized protein n=1 Tax=Caldinitratiruptor microaerophilus TaxID=671077 RepID=A0AA35CII5_9FIRM|nr:hypothetical protein [Caldinitratiruptor microaerophilus]BDG59790.1 hypothetical protein caldi_08800 [Caldinitratiruptor microaerophilus]